MSWLTIGINYASQIASTGGTLDLISQPEYLEEAVTDIEVAYLNGVWSRTLRPGDSCHEGRDLIRVITTNPPEDNTLFKAQMLGFTVRRRVIKTLVKK